MLPEASAVLRHRGKYTTRPSLRRTGLFHVARNHSRVNRYNKALSVGLRHNIDVSFLPTNSSGLAMIYYAANYSTKLDTPLWKRAALMRAVFDGLTTEKHVEDEVNKIEVGEERLQRKRTKPDNSSPELQTKFSPAKSCRPSKFVLTC